MHQHSIQFPRRRGLFWTCNTSEVGRAYPFHVHEQLLTFLVLRTCEEGTDKRFDRVTCVGIAQRTDGPARNELLVKLLFPPLKLTKERHEFVRNLLETSSAELAQDFLKSFIFIHKAFDAERVCVPRCESPSIAYHVQCVLHCSHREQRPLSCDCFAYVYSVSKWGSLNFSPFVGDQSGQNT